MKEKALLIAGGSISLPFLSRKIREFGGREALYLAAADGGLTPLDRLSLVPDLILGDFDTVPEKTLTRYRNQDGIEIVTHNPVKDASDLELAAEALLERGMRRAFVFGALGGRADHSIANLRLLPVMEKRGISLELLDPRNHIFYAPAVDHEERVLRFSKPAGKKHYFSLFPWGGEVTVTLKGFRYPLEKRTIDMNSSPSLTVSNEILPEGGEVRFTGNPGTGLFFLETRD